MQREPDWDAMADQRLYAYLDSCEPQCEDCECEEAEHAEKHYVIMALAVVPTEDDTLYWSNEDGWGHLSTATKFTEDEAVRFNLPVDPEAEWVEQVCECKCHLNAYDPREDGEPDDFPDEPDREDY